MGVRISDKSNGRMIGEISDQDFQFLVDQLEEESSRDTDYFVDQAITVRLEPRQADSH